MKQYLPKRFGLGSKELVAFVGAGGKTTTMRLLGEELAADGDKVVITTTTKMGRDQINEPALWTDEPTVDESAFEPGLPLYVMRERSGDKALGFPPETVDALFMASSSDHVLVEADGARRMLIKAPAEYEPAIPSHATTVIVVMGAAALGQEIVRVAHRPERVEALVGLAPNSLLTPEAAASVLVHPSGGLKGVPHSARVVTVVANVTDHVASYASTLSRILEAHDRIDRSLLVQTV